MDSAAINQASAAPEKPRPAVLKGAWARLVNEFQRDLPVSPRPFSDMAARLGWHESEVLDALAALSDNGVISRVGPVIRPNTIGVSALAAMAVPGERLEAVAALVSRRPEVNHNYEREHELNLWFVMTAVNGSLLDGVVRRIEAATGLAVMVLPMLEDYYIDLGFDLNGGAKPAAATTVDTPAIDEADRRLLAAIEQGLPLVPRPYRDVAETAGLSEPDVHARVRRLLDHGVIKRLGVIVRHHECGYRHNAMVVWDVPDDSVNAAGRRLADAESVRLCYRRPRHRPRWPYNLFCMIHGRDRRGVLAEVDRLTGRAGLEGCRRDVLFSVRRFKQRGARYGTAADCPA